MKWKRDLPHIKPVEREARAGQEPGPARQGCLLYKMGEDGEDK